MRTSVLATLLLAAPTLFCQQRTGLGLAPGRLLVADREVKDPNFSESVILLVRIDQRGAVGLVLNRPSNVSLARALQDMVSAKGRTDPIYAGGPVGRTGVLALLRTAAAPTGATRVFDGVYLISSKPLLADTLTAGQTADMFRVYLGYAGWGLERLEKEVALGLWHVLPGDAGIVFFADPASLWRHLAPESGRKLAHLQP